MDSRSSRCATPRPRRLSEIATIIAADLWRIGQTGLGGKLRFEQTSYPDALAAQDEVSTYLDKLRANVRSLGSF